MAHTDPKTFPQPPENIDQSGTQTCILAGGCFWCTEGVFERVPGVSDVVSGYTGGEASTATYERTCAGDTGHAEAIKITYDASQVSYGQLLRIYFGVAHDPTHLNRQGNDRGTQYRSAVFYETEDQRRVAENYVKAIDEAGVFSSPIATTLEPLGEFYDAERYHQDFVQNNPQQPYVCAVAVPKIRNLEAWIGQPA